MRQYSLELDGQPLADAPMLAWHVVRLSAVLVLLCHFRSPACADPIGPGAFGTGAIVESFEGLVAGPDIPAHSTFGDAYLVPDTTTPFTFGTGVALVGPVPNTGDSSVIFVGDFALGEARWLLFANGTVSSAADVPFGSAYLGDCCPEGNPIRLKFPGEVRRVGVYATDAGNATITMSAFDTAGSLLESVSASSVPVAGWGSNFLGIQHSAGIASITLVSSGPGVLVPVYDGLIFEVVPEPGGAAIAAAGLLNLASARRRLLRPSRE